MFGTSRKRLSKRDKRRTRIRKKISGTADRPRLSVYRSLKHTYAQLVDDTTGKSLATVSTKTKDLAADIKAAKGKVQAAKIVGKAIADLAKTKEISSVVFDRGGYLYHGRVRAVAEGAREGGLQF